MKEEERIIDGEKVQVVKVEPMELDARVDVTQQSARGLELFRERARVAKEQLKIALDLTQPGQWIVMDGGDGKETVYATAGAADRILRMGYGMRWGEKTVTLERTEQAIVATCAADLLMTDGRVYERFSGVRRGPFDASREGGIRGFLKNENDLIKGAIANMHHVAVTTILGLRFLTPADFKALGMDLSKLPRRASFQDHGGDDVPSDVPTVPFGKLKGKPITELGEQSLAWYIGAAEKAIADPAKAKYKAKEEAWLAALKRELDKRTGGGEEPPTEREPGQEG